MQLLKQSTTATVTVGPVLDADGVAVTTAVLADFSIAKNGSVATLTGATVTHSTNGYYLIALTVSNTDSLGRLDIIVNNSAMSMSNHRYDVLVAATYDAIVTNGIATSAQATAIQADTDDIQTRIPAALVSGRMDASVGAMASNVITAAAMATDASGEIADAVWDEPYAGHKTAGSFGKLMDLLRKSNMVVEGTVLASPTPTTTTFNVSGLNYPTGAFEHAVLFFADDSTLAEQNSPILTFTNNGNGTQTIVLEEARTAAPVAGDTVLIDATSHVHAIADIQTGLATTTQLTTVEGKIDTLDNYVDTEVAAIKAKTDNLPSDPADASDITAAFTEIKGAGWSSGTDTLEKIADTAGSSNITISPLAANDIQRVEGTSITLFLGEAIAVGPVAVFDSSTPAAPVNLTSFQPLELVVSKKFGGDIVVIPNASITISGVNNNNFSVNSSGGTNIPGIHAWALRKVSTQQVLAYGDWKVLQAAIKDS
jgi:hypothetical protein